jgi:hypothetical protein
MQSGKRIIALAKKMARNSFDEGTGAIDSGRVHEMIAVVRAFPERMRNALLRRYQYFLGVEQMNRTVIIEYVGDCEVGKFHGQMEQLALRKLQLRAISVPELVAGMRVTFGDQIWERSIRSDLETICRG